MTIQQQVAATEWGVVRVFQLSGDLAARLEQGQSLTPLADALGTAALDPDHVQIATLNELNAMGLAGLLEEGHGIAHGTLAPDRALLAGLDGTVAILRSRAFGGEAHTLNIGGDCRLIATYIEEGAPPPRLETLSSAGAEGNLDGAATGEVPDYQTSRRTLLIGLAVAVVLAVIVFALTRGGT